MSGTQEVQTPRHDLIQRQGARSGSLHAAVPLVLEPLPAGVTVILGGRRGGKVTVWRTACGEELAAGPRGVIVRWTGEAAQLELAAHPELVCRRCDRVGTAL